MIRAILFLAALLLPQIAFAQPAAVSAPDPFVFVERFDYGGNRATTGLTARTQAYNPAQRNLALIMAGQSNCENVNPTLFIPGSSSAIDQFSIYDGGSYNIAGPLVGSTIGYPGNAGAGPGNVGARLAQIFITNGIFDRVVVASICIGSTLAVDWATGVESARIPIVLKRMIQRGISPTATGWTFAISWWHGESDGAAGTSQASYVASMNTILATAQAAGFNCATCRFFVNIQTRGQGINRPTIQAAQIATVNGNPTKFFLGGNIDTLGDSYRLADKTHLNDTGAPAAAQLVYDAMHASGAPF